MKKMKCTALCLIFCMLASMLPAFQLSAFQLPAAAASVSGTDTGSENALQALGIDTPAY